MYNYEIGVNFTYNNNDYYISFSRERDAGFGMS